MLISFIVTVIGLCFFEVITSVDNAIINASVLKTVNAKYRRFFLVWGILFAVFVVRGLLPLIIIWIPNNDLSLMEILKLAFSKEGHVEEHMKESAPLLLLGGGMYLTMVFLSWLFLEKKKYAFFFERFITRQSIWFYAISSILITVIIYLSIKENPILALSASIGSSAFFLTDGFKKNAEEKEKHLSTSNIGDLSKIIYLEMLDASFSIDGVIGAFAFTMSIPLIILGNGLGAFLVREITIKWINVISRYAYLKNGAMYSIGALGVVMILESFGKEQPFWLAPLNTIVILSIFLYLSYKETKKVGETGIYE